MPVNPEDMIQLLMKTNADQEECLKEKDQTISDLRATVEELRNTVTDLRSTIANLNETLCRQIHGSFLLYFFAGSTKKAVCTFPSTARKKTGLRKESLFQGIPEHTGTTTVLWNTLPLYMKHFTRSF